MADRRVMVGKETAAGSGPRARWLLAAGALLLAANAGHYLWLSARTWDFNAIRLYRSFALAAGIPLYPPPGEGLALITVYGPVGAVAYLPAVLAATPTAAILIGQLLSLTYFLAPVLWLCLRGHRGGRQETAGRLAVLVFLTFTLVLWPLRYAALTVHVDAPALGLGALACGALTFHRPGAGTRGLWLAALAAVLALWTKQVMVALLPALILYLQLAAGAKEVGRFLVRLTAVVTASLLAAVAFFGPLDHLYFHLVTVLTSHGWRYGDLASSLGPSLRLLVWENAALWALLLATGGLLAAHRSQDRDSSPDQRSVPAERGPRRDRWPASTALWLAGACLLPVALLGRVKVGGDANAFSYTAYYLLAGSVLALRDLALAETPPWSPAARRLLWGCLLAGLPLLTLLSLVEASGGSGERASLPHETAYRYARRHPGEIYFPRLGLATYLAEGRLYHSGSGLLDPLSTRVEHRPEHLAAHLPPRFRAVAYFRNGYLDQVDLLPLAGLAPAPDDPELPGFALFSVPEGSYLLEGRGHPLPPGQGRGEGSWQDRYDR